VGFIFAEDRKFGADLRDDGMEKVVANQAALAP
jgi:hypothetical protein